MSEKNETRKKYKKIKNTAMQNISLFLVVFIISLAALSFLVKLFTPKVDVQIGDNETVLITEKDMDVEVRPIDERLKWIKMEDEMPSASMKNSISDIELEQIKPDKSDKTEKVKENKKTAIIPKIEINDDILSAKRQEKVQEEKMTDFRNIPISMPTEEVKTTPVIPLPAPAPTVTKVYLGEFTTLEEAMNTQKKLSVDEPDSVHFIKAMGNKYVIQVGSFSNKDIAESYIQHLKAKGYNPKKMESY